MKKQKETKEIINGWKEVKLLDVLDYEQPGNYIVKNEILDEETKIPVLTANKGFIKGYTKEIDGIYKDIPVIIFDDFTTDSKYVTFPFKVKSSAMKMLKLKNKEAILKFIFYQMQTINVRATTHKRYYLSEYQNLNFLFPTENDNISFKKQDLIVQEIEKQLTRLDETVKSLNSVKEKLEIYRKAVLKKAFDKKEGWVEKKLNNICEKITDGAHYTPRYFDKGYPFLSVKNRKSGKLDFDNINLISKEDFNKLKNNDCNPKKGDVLFSKDGTVGEVIKIDYERDFIVLSSWAILRPNKEIIQDYLYWLMRSPNVFNQSINLKTGTAIRRIILRNLKEVKVSYPTKIHEQQAVVQLIEDKFSVIDKIEQIVEESLMKSEKLRKSILKSAFEGKLIEMEEE